MSQQSLNRCAWVDLNNPLYIEYHDREWGRPVYDQQKLFEFLILEGMQAGLSWATVLKKRAHMQQVFDAFDAEKIVNYSDKKIAKLLTDPGIIRNRLKIKSLLQNAHAYINMKARGENLADFLWEFVGHQPIINHYKDVKSIPAQTALSSKISKALKQQGFNFVGPTICYALMQAVGMVNDHTTDCYLHGSNN